MKKPPKTKRLRLDWLIALGLGLIATYYFYPPTRVLLNDISNNLSERHISAAKIEYVATVKKNIPYCNTTNPAQAFDLYLPMKATGPVPLVIFIHGGGWEFGDKVSKVLSYYGMPLVEKGIAVASLNYRMHPESHYPAAYDDINCAIKYLYEHAGEYGLSAKKWGIMGDSAGAELAAYGLQNNPTMPITAFVGFYGPYDLSLQLTRTPRHDVNAANFLGSRDLILAKSVSPISMPVKTSASYFLIHGTQDAIVPYEQSVNYYRLLKQAGASATLVSIPDTGHYVSPTSKPNRAAIQKMVTQFIRQKVYE